MRLTSLTRFCNKLCFNLSLIHLQYTFTYMHIFISFQYIAFRRYSVLFSDKDELMNVCTTIAVCYSIFSSFLFFAHACIHTHTRTHTHLSFLYYQYAPLRVTPALIRSRLISLIDPHLSRSCRSLSLRDPFISSTSSMREICVLYIQRKPNLHATYVAK